MATPAQEKLVADILSSGGDLAQLLGIDNKSTFDDIKKRYRKLVLLVHPDKNKAENAKKAFQLLQTTFDQAEAYLKLRDRQEKVDATATVHTQQETKPKQKEQPAASNAASSTGAFFFSCPKCSQRLRTFTAYVEMQLSCLGCGHAFTIKQTEASPKGAERGEKVRFEANSTQSPLFDSDLSDDSFFDSSDDPEQGSAAPPPPPSSTQQNEFFGVPLPPGQEPQAQQPRPEPKPAAKPKRTSWNCNKCNQLNLPRKTKCSICGSARKKTKTAARPTRVLPHFGIGDQIEVRLSDGSWNLSVVESVDDKRQIYFLKGGKKASFAAVRKPQQQYQQQQQQQQQPSGQVFSVGDTVSVLRSTGAWCPCSVIAADTTTNQYTVTGVAGGISWTKSLSFQSPNIRLTAPTSTATTTATASNTSPPPPPPPPSASSTSPFRETDKVEVRRQNGIWAACTITAIDTATGLVTVSGTSDEGVKWSKSVSVSSPSIRMSTKSSPDMSNNNNNNINTDNKDKEKNSSLIGMSESVEVLRNGTWMPCIVTGIDNSAGLYVVKGVHEGVEWTKGLAFISPAIRRAPLQQQRQQRQHQQQQQQPPAQKPEPVPQAPDVVQRPKPPKASATKPWQCSNCSLPNKAKTTKCSMCGTRRQKKSILLDDDMAGGEGSSLPSVFQQHHVEPTVTPKVVEEDEKISEEVPSSETSPPPPPPPPPPPAEMPAEAPAETLLEMKQRIRDELRAEMQRDFEAEKQRELEALQKKAATEVDQLKAKTLEHDKKLTDLQAEANAKAQAHEEELENLRQQAENAASSKLQQLEKEKNEIEQKAAQLEQQRQQEAEQKSEALAQLNRIKEAELLNKQKEEERIAQVKREAEIEKAAQLEKEQKEKEAAVLKARQQEAEQREREIAELKRSAEEQIANKDNEKEDAVAKARQQEAEEREQAIATLKKQAEEQITTVVLDKENEKEKAVTEARQQELDQREQAIAALKKEAEDQIVIETESAIIKTRQQEALTRERELAELKTNKEAELANLEAEKQRQLQAVLEAKEKEEQEKLQQKEEEMQRIRTRKEEELNQVRQQITAAVEAGEAATAQQLSAVATLTEQLSHLSSENIRKAHKVAQLASKVQQHEEDAAQFEQRKRQLAQREREEARKAALREAEEEIRLEKDRRKAKEESNKLRREAARERLKTEIKDISRTAAGVSNKSEQSIEDKDFIAASLRHKKALESQLQETERLIDEQNAREIKLQQLMTESETAYSNLQKDKEAVETDASTEQNRLKSLLSETEELLEQERACAAFFAEQIQAEHALKKTQLKKSEHHAAAEFAMHMQQAESEGAKMMRAEYERQLNELQLALSEEKECAEFFAQQLTEQRRQQRKVEELITQLEEERNCAEFFASAVAGERDQRLELEQQLQATENAAALNIQSATDQATGLQDALNNVVAERLTEVASLKGEVHMLENKLSAAQAEGKNLAKKNINLQKQQQQQQQPSVIRVEVVGSQQATHQPVMVAAAPPPQPPQPPPQQQQQQVNTDSEEVTADDTDTQQQSPSVELPTVVSSSQKKADIDFGVLPELDPMEEGGGLPPPPPPPPGRSTVPSESVPFDSDSSDEEDGLYLLQKHRQQQSKKVEIPSCPFPDSDDSDLEGASPFELDPTRRSGVDGMKTKSGRGLFRCPSCDVGFPEELTSIDLPATCPACNHLFLLLSTMLVMTCEDEKREDRKFAFGKDFGGPSFEEKKRRILAESGRQEDLFMVGKCTDGKEEASYHNKKERVLNQAALGAKSETADQQIANERRKLGEQRCPCGAASLGLCIHCDDNIKGEITLAAAPSAGGLCPCGAAEVGMCLFCD